MKPEDKNRENLVVQTSNLVIAGEKQLSKTGEYMRRIRGRRQWNQIDMESLLK
jgi:hypothetical protein